MKDCKHKDKHAEDCPCVKLNPGCPRIGICCECIRFHRAMKEEPECVKQIVKQIAEERTGKTAETGKKEAAESGNE
ncbi:MAG: hypothetical protein ACYS8W_19655 [Planctomycetota bacterium]